VLVTSGSQQGLDLCGKLFSHGGIAMENPGYLGAALAFRANGVAITPVPAESVGPDSRTLSAAGRAGVEAYYGMTRFQNPRGGSYDRSTVDRVAGDIEAAGLLLIEDDPYGELQFDGQSGSELVASRIPDSVIYCGSFSKSVAPSLRIGFVRAPQPLIRELERLKQGTDLHTSRFLQLALVELLTSGRFNLEEHLVAIRTAYAGQRDALVSAVEKYLESARLFAIPSGGMFLWVELPESTSELFERAIRQGVAFVPGEHFYLDDEAPATGMRLNFSNLSREDLTDAVRRLAACRVAVH
jgi:2-aminoadipate transaminase